MNDERKDGPELVAAPRVPKGETADDVGHLTENRRLIVRRSLLATAVGGAVPLPVLDDYLAGRVRAGMLMKLAERRRVDIAPSCAELLGDPREGTTLRNLSLTALTLLAMKRAWTKIFAVLALGRRAEEMATSFQLGVLFDHYCTRLHVGSGIDQARALELRGAIFGALAETERGALADAFREGGRVLGRSVLEAPTWVGERIERAARRWSETGGQTADPGDAPAQAGAESEEDVRWLDKAAGAVESRIGRVEQNYLSGLVRAFERRWQDVVQRREAAAADPSKGKDGANRTTG